MTEDENPLRRRINWSRSGDPCFPFEATVDGEPWKIGINDFPDYPLYSLYVGDREVRYIDDWPQAWTKSASA